MKYYKPEYFDASKMKKGPVDTTKRDIFGKKCPDPNSHHREQFFPEIGYINSRKVSKFNLGSTKNDANGYYLWKELG
jgi:hypothetical protein